MIDHQFVYSSMSIRKVKEAEFGILFVSRLCSCWCVVADNGRQQHRLRQPSSDPFSSNKLMQIAPNAHGKLRAIIELMALRVREKQCLLCTKVMERLNRRMLLPLDRKDFCRPHRPTLRDARTTEQLERKQCADCERRVVVLRVDSTKRFHLTLTESTGQFILTGSLPCCSFELMGLSF